MKKVFCAIILLVCSYAFWACNPTPSQEEEPTYQTYTLTYILDGGTNHPDNPSEFKSNQEDFILKAPTKDGFEFVGWSEITGGVFSPQNNMTSQTLTANWATPRLKFSAINEGLAVIQVKKGDAKTDGTVYIPQYYFGKLVNAIADNAFQNCETMTQIVLPQQLVYIGDMAFQNCKMLSKIRLSDSLHEIGFSAFENCVALKSFSLENTFVESIESATFKNCLALENLDLPTNLKRIGFGAFQNCKALKAILLSDQVEQVDSYAFFGCQAIKQLHVPKNVQKGYGRAYSTLGDCISLEKITVHQDNTAFVAFDGVLHSKDGKKLIYYPAAKEYKLSNVFAGVDTIGSYALSGNQIGHFMMPDGIVTIESFAFSNCLNLNNFSMTLNIEGFGEDVFEGCTLLKKMYIPPKANFSPQTFRDCPNLETISVDLDHQAYMSDNGAVYSKNQEVLYYVPEGKDATEFAFLPETCFIDEYAFYNNKKMQSITLPNSVHYLAQGTFQGCENLASIVLPGNLFSIYEYVFSDCVSLKEIRLPKSVTTINNYAFENWQSNQKIFVLGKTQPHPNWQSNWDALCKAEIIWDDTAV